MKNDGTNEDVRYVLKWILISWIIMLGIGMVLGVATAVAFSLGCGG